MNEARSYINNVRTILVPSEYSEFINMVSFNRLSIVNDRIIGQHSLISVIHHCDFSCKSSK